MVKFQQLEMNSNVVAAQTSPSFFGFDPGLSSISPVHCFVKSLDFSTTLLAAVS